MLLTLVQLNLPLTFGYCIIMQGKECWNVITLSSKNHLNFLTFKGTSFVDRLCYFCVVFVMLSGTSVYWCRVVTCWERADL